MPPQGGGDHSDFEIARAVVFMANKSGAKFDEPKPPAAAASAAATHCHASNRSWRGATPAFDASGTRRRAYPPLMPAVGARGSCGCSVG